MSYDYKKLFDEILTAIGNEGSITNRMQSVIRECERQRSHLDWDKFSDIDFEADIRENNAWLQNALANLSADEPARGLWIGLTQVQVNGEVVADAYAAVSSTFESNALDWAYKLRRDEQTCYAESNALKCIYKIAYSGKDSLGNDAEYPLVLAYSSMMVRSLLEAKPLPDPLKQLAGVAVGYDGGDFLFLGEFADGKFSAHVRTA